MKKHVVLGLAISLSTLGFSQKKEVKLLEKAVKSGDFDSAKTATKGAEALLSLMDDKTKAKFYFLKAQSFYANGAGNDADVSTSIEALQKVSDVEKTMGKFTFKEQAKAIKQKMVASLYEKGQAALNSKDFNGAASNFEKAYRVSKDTVYLYNAALLAQNAKDYDKTLGLYDELTTMGYTGIEMQYFATDVASGEEQAFPNKNLRDLSVKTKTHVSPRDNKTKSKVAEIAKNTALIYVQQGKNDEAFAAIEKAKSLNPGDYNLLISEANIRYQTGDKARYKELIEEAIKLQPDNADLIFNLGVVSSENGDKAAAKKYFERTVEVNPNYANAYTALANLEIAKEQAIVDEMNGLGTSSADDKRFEELKVERTNVYNSAIPFLEKALKANPKSVDAARTLMNLYSAIDNTDKFNEMKALVAKLTGN